MAAMPADLASKICASAVYIVDDFRRDGVTDKRPRAYGGEAPLEPVACVDEETRGPRKCRPVTIVGLVPEKAEITVSSRRRATETDGVIRYLCYLSRVLGLTDDSCCGIVVKLKAKTSSPCDMTHLSSNEHGGVA